MEKFKEIEIKDMTYTISSYGRVFGKRGELKQRLNRDGYLEVTIGKTENRTCARVHRLVMIAFNPCDNMEELEVNHKDCNRTNNKLDNLEWITHIDNVHYSSNKGNYKGNTIGCKNGRANYTEEEIKYMRELYDNGNTVMDIIKILFPNLNYKERKNKWSRIKEIVTRQTYSDI